MAVLSVDLATRRWSDLGIVVLEHLRPAQPPKPRRTGVRLPLKPVFAPASASDAPKGHIVCEIIPWNDPGPVDAETLAGRLNHLCGVRGIRVIMLDGPQAWKSRSNGLEHARIDICFQFTEVLDCLGVAYGKADPPAGHAIGL